MLNAQLVKTTIHAYVDAVIPAEDKDAVEKYLLAKWKRSPYSYATARAAINLFYAHVQKSVVEIAFNDIDSFFERVDNADLARGTKVLYWNTLRGFVREMIYQHNRANGTMLVDPFPPGNVNFNVNTAISKVDTEKIDSTADLVRDDVMDTILTHARRASQREYVFLLLLKHCGMRESECKSIRVENVHLDERYIVTGIVHGCRKSNTSGETPSVYFFPKSVALQLRQYLLLLAPGEEWLFPQARMGKTGTKSYQDQYYLFWKRYSKVAGVHLKSHQFRKTLISKRKKMRLASGEKIDVEDSNVLMNHVGANTQQKFYYKLSISERRALYDKWDPYK